MERIADYLLERTGSIFAPLLDYLAEAGDPRALSEINTHFAPKLAHADLFLVCDWLAEHGILEKLASPVYLTRKSQMALEEASSPVSSVATAVTARKANRPTEWKSGSNG
jgi:hypothetical protein